ncbi:MAG TPA: BadF/BadG/BcrA/BcrD ATPase family protein [Candidatus Baltobacteraceae bacterium]|nr:BadF/BadG/BcrA/BcrD ATPase family protein [Candidatus Baltobacteraceae bacterium]
MPILVGIDAGGTSIECIVERDGARTQHRGDGANVRTAGIEWSAQRIAQAALEGLAGLALDVLAVGAAGAGDPSRAQALQAALRGHFPGATIAVYDDAEIALRAAIPHGDAAVLIAGTGSIAYARIANVAYRAGGYGYLLGDDGSGFTIGRAALAQLLRNYDGRTAHEPLFTAIEERLDARDGQAILDRIYSGGDSVSTIASIAPLVIERASAGERLATKIVQAAALELVDLIKALVRRAQIEGRELPLVFAGGLLRENSVLSFLIETRLGSDFPLLHPIKSPPSPAHGALELARRLHAR